jgi:hypothetical protein
VRASPGLSINFKPWQAAGDTLQPVSFEQLSLDRRPRSWLVQLVSRRKSI